MLELFTLALVGFFVGSFAMAIITMVIDKFYLDSAIENDPSLTDRMKSRASIAAQYAVPWTFAVIPIVLFFAFDGWRIPAHEALCDEFKTGIKKYKIEKDLEPESEAIIKYLQGLPDRYCVREHWWKLWKYPK